MVRRVGGMLALSLVAGGCAKPAMDMGPPKKPDPAPEMKKLERFTGTWNWTGEMVCPTKEEIMKQMPPGSKEPQTQFSGSGKGEMILGGTALKMEGSFEFEGQKMTYLEYWMWDGKARKYRAFSISDWGEIGLGWVTPCEDCDGYCTKAEGTDAQGMKKRYEGCMTFTDKDTHEWSFTEHGPMGKMSMKGTSKRGK